MDEQKIEVRLTPKCVMLFLNGERLRGVTRIDEIKPVEYSNLTEVTMTIQVKEFNVIDLDGNIHSIRDIDEVQDV